MIFLEAKLKGVYIVEPERIEDSRGFFARTWCKDEFRKNGLNPDLVQCNISFNREKGTLRGMHYQNKPYWEAKLVRCTRGVIYDVVIDLRPQSETYKQWMSMILTSDDRKMLYIPEGFAHGFQTVSDNTEVFYQMSEYYHPECACGIRWNDEAFGLQWPLPVINVSDKDNSYVSYI